MSRSFEQGDVNGLLRSLGLTLRELSTDTTVSVSIFFNCDGVTVETSERTPESLMAAGISMRNLRGEFIK